MKLRTGLGLAIGLAAAVVGCGSDSAVEDAAVGGSSGASGTGGSAGSGGTAGSDGGGAGGATGGTSGAGGTAGQGGSGGTSGSGGVSGSGGSSGAPPSSVEVVLHPGSTVAVGEPTLFAFGLPLPPGAVDDVSAVVLLDPDSQEVASHVVETARWRSLGSSAGESVRSATVWASVTFDAAEPVTYQVALGTSRSLELGAQGNVRDHWVATAQGLDPNEYTSTSVLEPPVYAAFPATWLGSCRLRAHSAPIEEAGAFGWFDTAFLEFSNTAVNDVGSHVTPDNLINYEGDYEPWLFDRAMTLFGTYARTGDVDRLRHAHRAAQFYAAHVNGAGYFDLKTPDDLKYSYGQAMLLDMMLVGDTDLAPVIERVGDAGMSDGFNVEYTIGSNFWTERHLTYALLSALSAWEATGAAEYAGRVQQVVNTAFAHALNPPGGWSVDGCLLHTMESHEGSSDTSPVCSPWMSALFGEAVWRYYLYSEDEAALTFLSGLGDYLVEHGTYVADEGELNGMTVPYYLSSSVLQFTDSGPWADVEHTCDVMGLAARSAYAKGLMGQDNAQVVALADALQVGCEWNLEHWHRDGQATIDAGLTVWRLSPPRKYSWWFGTTSDYVWLRDNL